MTTSMIKKYLPHFYKGFFKSLSEPIAFTYCKNSFLSSSHFYHVGWKLKESNKPLIGNTLSASGEQLEQYQRKKGGSLYLKPLWF